MVHQMFHLTLGRPHGHFRRIPLVTALAGVLLLGTPAATVQAQTASTVATPSATGQSASVRLEAESYGAQSGVASQATADTGGGDNIGWINDGDWTRYDALDFGAGLTGIDLRLASGANSGTIEIHQDTTTGPLLATIAVTPTGGWQAWQTRHATLTRTVAGVHSIALVFHSTSGDFANLNWLQFTTPATTVPTPPPAVTPVDLRVEAESYGAQSGVASQATADTGGGDNIGWINDGDWTRYDALDFGAGLTGIDLRLASGANSGTIEIHQDTTTGPLLATIAVTPTGGWQAWQTRHATLTRTVAGVHSIALVFHSTSGDFANLNWLQFTTPATTIPTAPPASVPSPTTPPSSQRNCAATPSSCGYPDASNTGVPTGTVMRRIPEDVTSGAGWHYDSRGWIEIDGAGTVFDSFDVANDINVSASNVTIRNCRIRLGGESQGIGLRHTNNVTIQDSQINSPNGGDNRLMVGIKDIYGDSTGLKILRTNIWNTSTAIQVESGLIKDNYIHDLGYKNGDHVNGTTSNGGTGLLTIDHNTVFNSYDQTDAISLFQDFGNQANRTISNNLLAGGGYTIYAGANPGKLPTSNITITNNRISRKYFPNGGSFGPITAYNANGTGNSFTGNIWDDTGQSLAYGG